MDAIRLLDIVLAGHHGVTPAEREAGQKLGLDVELEADLDGAARDDALEAAIDYREVYRVVERVVVEQSCRLLETLAARIASELLATFPATVVRIKIRKANAGVSGNLGCVEVAVERKRS